VGFHRKEGYVCGTVREAALAELPLPILMYNDCSYRVIAGYSMHDASRADKHISVHPVYYALACIIFLTR
jgi:hypothetical protein